MLKFIHKVKVNKSPKKIYGFFLKLDTKKYRKWFKDHLKYEVKKREKGMPKLIYMEEYIGKRLVKLKAELIKYKPNRLFVFASKEHGKGTLSLDFKPENKGTLVTHTLTLEFPIVIEWFFKISGMARKFEKELGSHVKEEFKLLEKVIR